VNIQKTVCLNCGTKTIGKYCHTCAQKSDTKRLNLKHFLTHDIIHGALHLDKGLLFTFKEIILRPGKVALNYINGKRVSYYNFFYLVLILIGFILFMRGMKAGRIEHNSIENVNDVSDIENFFKEKYKYLLLSFIPLFSISSFLAYRKAKLNIAEHVIITGVLLIYYLIYSSVWQLSYMLFPKKTYFDDYFVTISIIILMFFYYQVFFDIYSKRKFFNLVNALLTIILFSVLLSTIFSAFVIIMIIMGKIK
jgi:hypothetical protein